MSKIDDRDFTCTKCGDCCKWPGFVYLVEEDIGPLATRMTGGDQSRFLAEYTDRVGPRSKKKQLVLADKPETSECVFLDERNKCGVYDTRPKQCKEYPLKYEPGCPGFSREVQAMDSKMKTMVEAVRGKLAGAGEFDRAVSKNLYDGLQKEASSASVVAKAIEGGVSGFFDDNTVKVASLDDLFGFNRVDDKHLIHKATRDLWRIEPSNEGGVQIARLFEAGKPVKG